MTQHSDAQQMYWDITDRVNLAKHHHRLASRDFAIACAREDDLKTQIASSEIVEWGIELSAAEDAYAAFCRDHVGQSFLVFVPERIRAAVSDDIKPLFGTGGAFQ